MDLCRVFPFKAWTVINMCLTRRFRKTLGDVLMRAFADQNGACQPPLYVPATKNPLSQDCILTPGMPLVGRSTHRKQGLFNAGMYTFVRWEVEIPRVPDLVSRDRYDESATTFKIPICDFHEWMRHGFAVTIDSSQGRTIRERFTMWEVRHPLATAPRKYVGVSRGTQEEDVQCADCNPEDLAHETITLG